MANDIEIAASEERGGDDLSIIPPTGRTIVNVIDGVELEENSAVQAVMRISGDIAGVPIVQRITLYQGLKRVDLEDRVDWKPGRSMNIEQVFPLPQPNMEVRNRHSVRICDCRRHDAECGTAQWRRGSERHLETMASDSGLGFRRHGRLGIYPQRRPSISDGGRQRAPGGNAARHPLQPGKFRARRPADPKALAAGRHVRFPLLLHFRQRRLGRGEIVACRNGVQHAADSSQFGK